MYIWNLGSRKFHFNNIQANLAAIGLKITVEGEHYRIIIIQTIWISADSRKGKKNTEKRVSISIHLRTRTLRESCSYVSGRLVQCELFVQWQHRHLYVHTTWYSASLRGSLPRETRFLCACDRWHRRWTRSTPLPPSSHGRRRPNSRSHPGRQCPSWTWSGCWNAPTACQRALCSSGGCHRSCYKQRNKQEKMHTSMPDTITSKEEILTGCRSTCYFHGCKVALWQAEETENRLQHTWNTPLTTTTLGEGVTG